MTEVNKIFDAVVDASKGPTIDELFLLVEPDFKQLRNEWRIFASTIRKRGGSSDIGNWRFRQLDAETVAHRRNCIAAVMAVQRKPDNAAQYLKADAIVAQMLCDTLEDPPRYTPAS